MARPIIGIAPFIGKAAKWLRDYLECARPDPEKIAEQERRDEEICRNIIWIGKGSDPLRGS